MKITMVLITCLLMQVQASTYAQRITVNKQNSTIQAVLEEIRKQSRYDFFYDTDIFNEAQHVSVRFNNASVEQVLDACFSGQPYQYTIKNRLVMISQKENTAPALRGSASLTKPLPQQQGRISGRVLDDNGDALAGATIRVIESGQSAQSGGDGSYQFSLAPRSYTVEASFLGHQTKRITEVTVKGGQTTNLNIVLNPATAELGQVVVTGSYKRESVAGLYTQQKNRSAITDGISRQQIANTSDNNAAQSLRRVAGVSVNDGNFVTVRGLSERYNNTNVNGASMPSTEPNRKNFAFNIIPTGLIDNMVVAKTFTPDMSAEFAGGTVEVNTLSIPTAPFMTFSLGTNINTNSTGKDLYFGKRYNSDYFFGRPGERYWMGRDWDYNRYMALENDEDKRKMNAAIPNLWNMYRSTGRPTQSYSLSLGKPYHFGDHELGFVFGGTYRHEERRSSYGWADQTDSLNVQYLWGPSGYYFPSNEYNFTTVISGVGNVGWRYKDHKINWKNFYSNRFTHTGMLQVFETDEGYGKALQTLSSAQRNQIVQTRLEGEHALLDNRLILNWYGDYNKLNRETPDDRNVRGQYQSGEDAQGRESFILWGTYIGTTPGAYDHIYYTDLKENKKNIGLALTAPFTVSGNLQKVKVGYDGNFRKADFIQRQMNIGDGTNNAIGYRNQSLEDYLNPQLFLDGTFYYIPYGQNPEGDGYNGHLNINSLYGNTELAFVDNRIHLTAGARMEKARMENNGMFRNAAGNQLIDTVRITDKTDWFPAFGFIGNITSQLNLRANYSKTISRFDFREQSLLYYQDMLQNMRMNGNPDIRNTYIRNLDFRLEWYPSAGEIISLSYFQKRFTDPIELRVRNIANSQQADPINLNSANGEGVELNVRKSLGFVYPSAFLKDLYVGANAMYMKMDIDMDLGEGALPEARFRERPLQNMTPYTLNGSLSYEGPKYGFSVNYITAGRKIIAAGNVPEQDIYEAPRHVLDAQVKARFLQNKLEIKLDASDLLAQPFVRYMNMGFKQTGNNFPGTQWSHNDYSQAYLDDMDYNKGIDFVHRKIHQGTTWSLTLGYRL